MATPADGNRKRGGSVRRVHVIGPPRSGTTLMLELLTVGFRFTAVAKQEVSLLRIPEGVPAQAAILTKRPQDHRFVRHLLPIDERLWFISLVRDPRDVVVSRHGARPDVYWANLRQWRGWFENTREFRGHPRLIEVRFETLVSDPDAVQDSLARRLAFLPRGRRFSEFHRVARPSSQSLQAMRGVRPINPASAGNWRNHLPRLAGQLKIHGAIDAELLELDYEDDTAWKAALADVVPDTTPGRWPEFSRGDAGALRPGEPEQLAAYCRWRGLDVGINPPGQSPG